MANCTPCKERGIMRVAHYQAGNGNPPLCYDCRNGGKVAVAVKEREEATETEATPSVSIRDVGDMVSLLSGVMAGVIEGSMTPAQAGAICGVADKLIKAIELRHKLELK